MALSTIELAVDEGFGASLAMFVRSGRPYYMWAATISVESVRQLNWRIHTGTAADTVQATVAAPFGQIAPLINDAGNLLVVFDDEIHAGVPTPRIFAVILNPDTGAVITDRIEIANGSKPALVKVEGAPSGQFVLTYRDKTRGTLWLRETYDNGVTWSQPRPALNTRVRDIEEVVALPFDRGHIVVGTVGRDARLLREVGSITRTRPLAGIVLDNVVSGRIHVDESAQRSTALADYMRGRILDVGSGSFWFVVSTRVGVDDGIHEIATYDCLGAAPALVTSVNPGTGDAARGRTAGRYNGGAIPQTVEEVFGASGDTALVDIASKANHLYFAGYSDALLTDGGLSSYNLGSGVLTQILSGFPVRAVCACSTQNVLAVATTESAVEYVRLYTVNADGSLTHLKTHRMPSRVNAVQLVMTSTTEGRLYVAMSDRLDIYMVTSLTNPIQRLGGWTIRSRGQFRDIKITNRGNIVAAMGEGGVGVFAQNGDRLAQYMPSGVNAQPWKPETAYALNDVVRPTAQSYYAPERHYFKCTVAGTSQRAEPFWNPAPTVTADGATLRFLDQGQTASAVASIALDPTNQRIYAVGVIGGIVGTQGRVWIFSAPALF